MKDMYVKHHRLFSILTWCASLVLVLSTLKDWFPYVLAIYAGIIICLNIAEPSRDTPVALGSLGAVLGVWWAFSHGADIFPFVTMLIVIFIGFVVGMKKGAFSKEAVDKSTVKLLPDEDMKAKQPARNTSAPAHTQDDGSLKAFAFCTCVLAFCASMYFCFIGNWEISAFLFGILVILGVWWKICF